MSTIESLYSAVRAIRKAAPWVLLVAGCVLLTPPLSQAQQNGGLSVSVRVMPNPARENQTFQLEITLSGSEAQSVVDVPLPNLSGFARYLGSQGTSQNIQIINGRMSVSKTFTYLFMATKSGTFTIPSVEVRSGGKTYRSQPVSIQILPAGAGGSRSAPGAKAGGARGRASDQLAEQIFLRTKVSKKRVYQGEPVVLTYSLYTRLNVTGYAITKLPSTTGFWVEDMEIQQPPPTYEELIDGVRYVVADIKKMALFPTAPGELKIEPMAVDCEVRVRRTSRPRDFFDAFFDDPFFGRTVRRTLYSPPVTIRVLPLPQEGRPVDFSGAVGRFRMSAKIDKDSVQTNEAITLTVKIQGTGNIKVIGEPKLELPPDLEKYEPKVTQRIDKSGSTIRGSKTFEYVLIPRFPGTQRIRPIRFSYFDPVAGEYRTLTSPEFVVRVARGKQALALGGGLSKEEVRLVGQDIRFIKTEVAGWRRIGRHFHNSALFYAGLIVPLLALGAAAGYRHQQDRLAENVALARSRRAQRQASQRLKRARSLLTLDTQKEFYAEVARALTGFLADKFNTSAAGLVSDQVERQLRERGVPEELISDTLALLNTCDFQRFAPAAADTSAMQETLRRAEKIIGSLEKRL